MRYINNEQIYGYDFTAVNFYENGSTAPFCHSLSVTNVGTSVVVVNSTIELQPGASFALSPPQLNMIFTGKINWNFKSAVGKTDGIRLTTITINDQAFAENS